MKYLNVRHYLTTASPGETLEKLFDSFAETGRFYRLKDSLAHIADGGNLVIPKPSRILPYLVVSGEALPVEDMAQDETGAAVVRRFTQGVGLDQLNTLLSEAVVATQYVRRLPEIHQIVNCPTWRPTRAGTYELVKPGWVPEERTLVVGRPYSLTVEPDPTYPHLKKAFSGALYLEPQYLSNLIGYTIACFVRCWLDGFPHLLLDSVSQSSGKTKIAEAVGQFLTGRVVVPAGFSSGNDALETKLGPYANKPGPQFILFDNVRASSEYSVIAAPVLARLAGSKQNSIRHLYVESSILCAPIIALSMNGSATDTDLSDKVVSIRFCLPSGATHRELDPYPIAYVEEHREEMLAEVAHIFSRLRSDWRPPTYGCRWFDFEKVAVQATEIMGLDPIANYSSAAGSTVDAFTFQLIDLLHSRFAAEGASADDIISAAQGATSDLYAIHRYLTKESHGAREKRSARLLDKIDRAARGSVKIDGVAYRARIRSGRVYLEKV